MKITNLNGVIVDRVFLPDPTASSESGRKVDANGIRYHKYNSAGGVYTYGAIIPINYTIAGVTKDWPWNSKQTKALQDMANDGIIEIQE